MIFGNICDIIQTYLTEILQTRSNNMNDLTDKKITAAEVSDPEKTRKRRFGDRYDGRRVRTLPPMQYITPFVMKWRCDASNYFRGTIELSAVTAYMREKVRCENMNAISFMHVLVAAYLRVIAEYPAMNRFIAGQRIFQRNSVTLSMMVKKDMSMNSQGTAIKTELERGDTIYDVYEKMEKDIEVARKQEDSTNMDHLARALFNLPAPMLAGFIGLMDTLDYFGIMPKFVNKASPFHASLFVSNLGSLGIQPIYHHLYNFGNIPVFITFGAIYKKPIIGSDGSIRNARCIDYTIVTDERITDGHYYAAGMKRFDWLLRHPEELDKPPAEVKMDVD